LASVPELVKRTRSIDGKRAQIAAANRTSVALCAPKLSPPSSAAVIAWRMMGCEWPQIPAVNSLRKSTYSCPSRSHSRAPSPRTIVNGNGSTWIAERVLPPGIALHAVRCWARLLELRARYCSSASPSAAATSILGGRVVVNYPSFAAWRSR